MPGGPILTKFISIKNPDQEGLTASAVAASRHTPVFVKMDVPVPAGTAVAPPLTPVAVKPLINAKSLLVNVGQVKYFNPSLSVLLSQVTPAAAGSTRADITVPVSNSEEVTDEQLFDAPGDATKKEYVSRFRIAENNTTSGNRFAVSLKHTDSGGTLDVVLEKYPAPSLGTAAATATEINLTITVLLRFNVSMDGGGTMPKELPFSEVTLQANGLHAVLPIIGLPQLNQVFSAMTESSYNACLVVRRVFDVAIPVSQRPGGIVKLGFPAKQMTPILRFPVNITEEVRRFPPSTGPGGVIMMPHPHQPQSAPPVEQLYRQTTRSLDNIIAFNFPVALNGYIFDGVAATGTAAGPALIKRQVGLYRYYEDTVESGLFYYLPDSFKITRRPAPSFAPYICVSINGDGSLDGTTATVEYAAMPYVDPARIKEALPQLQKDKDQVIQFQPLIAPATFSLALPDTAGLTGPFQERTNAKVELRDGIVDSVNLSLKNLQLLYDALMGASQTLFTGQVTVAAIETDKIQIPFSARLNDMLGDPYTIRQQYDAAAGKGTITLRNETESPFSIGTIRIMLSDGDTPVPFNSQGADINTLITLQPQQDTEITVVPVDTALAAKALVLDTEVSEIAAQPDREAIWNAILNPYTPIEYERTIAVETFDEIFSASSTTGGDTTIKALTIIFFNGDTVTLKPAALKADATVRVSLSNYILGKVDTRDYKYQVEVVTVAGKRKVGAPDQWITDQADQLFITQDLIK